MDEILQGYWIQGSWDFFWKSLKFDAVHPPLDYLIARGVEAFHPADWARKLPAVLWGTGTVAVLGALIGRRAGKAAGLLTALLLAFSPFHVRYSQEFRPYSLGLFTLCLSLLCLDWFLQQPGIARLLALYFACLAALYALYLAALVLGIAAAAMLIEDAFAEDPTRRRAARRFLAASPLLLAALFLAYLPWWPVVLDAARRPPMAARPALTLERFHRLLSFFTVGSDDAKGAPAGAFFVGSLAIAGAWIAARSQRLRFLAIWAVAGLGVIELLGQLHPHYDIPQHYLPAAIALPVLGTLSIVALLDRKSLGLASLALIILALLLDAQFLRLYFREGRPDWRPLARFLRDRPREERIFTENQYSQLCVAFYTVGPTWLADRGTRGRDVANLDGEIVRLTWSWKPDTTAWLVIAGEPPSPSLRGWAKNFPGSPFPTAESALLYRLDPALREEALPGAR